MGPMLASITAGLVAGVSSVPHCMGMCGPLVAGVCSGPRDGAAYQVGRTVSYSVLGAVAGGVLQLGTLPLSRTMASTLTSVVLAAGLLWAAFSLVRSGARARTTSKTHEGAQRPGDVELVPLRASRSAPARTASATGRWAKAVRPWLGSPLLVGALSALLPCGALLTLALLAAGAGSAWGGALTGAAFATATGAGLATSVWASALLRQSRAGARVVAAVLVLGAAIVSVRAFPQLLGGANEGAACHSDTGAVRAAPVARRP